METRLINAGRCEYVGVLRRLKTFELADLNMTAKPALRIAAALWRASRIGGPTSRNEAVHVKKLKIEACLMSAPMGQIRQIA